MRTCQNCCGEIDERDHVTYNGMCESCWLDPYSAVHRAYPNVKAPPTRAKYGPCEPQAKVRGKGVATGRHKKRRPS